MQQNTLVSRIILWNIWDWKIIIWFKHLVSFATLWLFTIVYKVQFLCCLVLYCSSCIFGYILLILTLFLNYVYHLIEKNLSKCARCIIFEDIYVQYLNFWSKDSNHKKVIVVVNCRTGYKFEYYKNKTQDSNK